MEIRDPTAPEPLSTLTPSSETDPGSTGTISTMGRAPAPAPALLAYPAAISCSHSMNVALYLKE